MLQPLAFAWVLDKLYNELVIKTDDCISFVRDMQIGTELELHHQEDIRGKANNQPSRNIMKKLMDYNKEILQVRIVLQI